MADALVPGADPIPGLSAADAIGVIPPIKPTPPAQLNAPPQTPPPGASLKLSDGSYLAIPEDATPEAVLRAKTQAESVLDQDYMRHAGSIDGPFATGDKVYSATHAYPNNVFGRSLAWLDHNAGGNWMNRNIAAPLNTATGDAGPAAMRIGTGALTWAPDLAASAYNVGKHYIAPSQGTSGDMPLLGQSFRQAIGSPELSADAPFWQAALEAGLAGRAASGSGLVRNLILGTTGTAGAEFGQQAGGEAGGLIGGILGGGGIPGRRLLSEGFARAFAHPDAQAIYEAAQRQGIEPSARSLMNPTGQRIAAVLGSVPFAGAPIEKANEATRAGIEDVRNQVATTLDPTLTVGAASPATIGEELIQGARQAIPRVQARLEGMWNPLNQAMADNPVDIAPILSEMNRSLAERPTTPANEAAIRNAVEQIASRAPGGAAGPPLPPGASLPQPTMPVPWSVVKDFRTGLGYQLGQGDVRVPGERLADIKGWTTDAMRNAAEAAQPGVGGRAFDTARTAYAQMKQNVLDRLYGLGGRPLGPGEFTAPASERTAYQQLAGNLQSPSRLEMFADPNLFSPTNWQRAAGQYISMLGNTGQDFRPEKFAKELSPQKIDPGALDIMTQGPQGAPLTGPSSSLPLQDAATVARNFSTPLARHGLVSSMGAAASIHGLLKELGGVLSYPAIYSLSRALESEGFKRALGGQPSQRAGFLGTLPVTGAIAAQEAGNRSPFLVPGTEAGIRQLYGSP